MTELQQRAILDYFTGKITGEALEEALGALIGDPVAMFDLLRDAVASRDASQIEMALMLALGRTGDLDIVPLLVELLPATYHRRHEDVTRTLQALRDPRAVDVLYKVALTKFDYLDYDDSYPLARKCTWALADIGTPEAKEKLRVLAGNDDPEIAGYARKRLDNWEKELGRKGPSQR